MDGLETRATFFLLVEYSMRLVSSTIQALEETCVFGKYCWQ